jgi:fructose-1,6-bisphosphatase I
MEQEANRIWIAELSASQRSCLLVSEDLPELLVLDEETQGKFVIVFDPLTGRADPPCTEMGAIFGIFRQLGYSETKGCSPDWRDALQPARQLVCAGYVLYGPSVVLCVSFGAGVQGFTLDGAMNDWVLTHPQIRIPFCGQRYSLDEGYEPLWDAEFGDAIRRFKLSVCLNGERRSLRRTGSMVADLHRVVVHGGVLLYPAHTERPRGQLKLLYEAGPLAFLVEQAGGRAIDGKRSLLDVRPTSLHEHVPGYLGSVDDIELLEQLLRKVDRDPMFQLRRSLSIQEGMQKRNATSVETHLESSREIYEEGGGILASALPLLDEDDC